MDNILERKERSIEFESNPDLCVVRKHVNRAQIHAHNYFEIEFILNGEGVMYINGKDYLLSRGFICLLSPSDFHGIRDGGNIELWNVSFSEAMIPPDCLSLLYFNFSNRCRLTGEQEFEVLLSALKLLNNEYNENGYTQPLMDYLLKKIVGVFSLQNDSIPQDASKLNAVLPYIEMHFRENPTLADVAKQACLSPVYFGNIFKQHFGMTYIKYLNQRKVMCAKMLLESGMSVTETCYSSGFGSMSGFLHSFKQITGMSPKEYKASFKTP